jgi:mono/diheme cytochrome c family protein
MGLQKLVWAVAVLMVLGLTVSAQQQPQTTIKHVTAPATSAASGSEMFKAYCAACHGVDGKGNGPAAPALKVPPTDLTSLSKNNGGKFPDAKVASTIRGEADIAAHGTREMPVWGRLFWSMSHGHEGEVQQRVSNLTQYVESLQAK